MPQYKCSESPIIIILDSLSPGLKWQNARQATAGLCLSALPSVTLINEVYPDSFPLWHWQVSDQMTTLLEETSLNQSDLQLRYLICDLLQEVLVEMFPQCRVFPYGSSVSGLGVKGCDLDLQVDLGRDEEQFKYQFASMPMQEEMDMETTEQVRICSELLLF